MLFRLSCVILPLSLALKSGPSLLLASLQSTDTLDGSVPPCRVCRKPGETRRAEAARRESINVGRPLTPKCTSAPALRCPQQGSSRGTSFRKGARGTSSSGGRHPPKEEFRRGSSPSAQQQLEFRCPTTCSAAEKGSEGVRAAAMTERVCVWLTKRVIDLMSPIMMQWTLVAQRLSLFAAQIKLPASRHAAPHTCSHVYILLWNKGFINILFYLFVLSSTDELAPGSIHCP